MAKTATLDDITKVLVKGNERQIENTEILKESRDAMTNVSERLGFFLKTIKSEKARTKLQARENKKERSGKEHEATFRKDAMSILLGSASLASVTSLLSLVSLFKFASTISSLSDDANESYINFEKGFRKFLINIAAVPRALKLMLKTSGFFSKFIPGIKTLKIIFTSVGNIFVKLFGPLARQLDHVWGLFHRLSPSAIFKIFKGLGRFANIIILLDAGVRSLFAGFKEFKKSGSILKAIGVTISTFGQYLLNYIFDTIKAVVKIISFIGRKVISFLGLDPLFKWLGDIEINMFGVQGSLSEILDKSFKAVAGLFENIRTILLGFIDGAVMGIVNVFDGLNFMEIINSTKDTISNIFETAKKVFKTIYSALPVQIKAPLDLVIKGVKWYIKTITSVFDKIKKYISDNIGKVFGFLRKSLKKIGITLPDRPIFEEEVTIKAGPTGISMADSLDQSSRDKRQAQLSSSNASISAIDASNTTVNNTNAVSNQNFIPPMNSANQFDPAYHQAEY